METSVFALHQAAKQNVYENVISLIKIGAEVDERDAKSGQTALHIAAAMNNVESIKALLDAGAAIDALDLCGDSPLALAQRANKPEAMNLLREASQRSINGNEQNGGSTVVGDKGGRVGMRGADRRKMKLHLESGTGLFENPPPVSPSSTKHPASSRAPPTTALPAMPPPSNAARQTAIGGSTITRRAGPSGGEPASPPVRRGSADEEGPNTTAPAGGWKKKDWSEVGASTPPAAGGGGKPLERSRGNTEFVAGSGGGSQVEGWKKMKSFFSTSAHPLPSQPPLPLTIEALQAQLQREISERRETEEELHKFKHRAGPLMHQLKRRYVESDDTNKTLTLRNEQLERELEVLKADKAVATMKPMSPRVPPRNKPLQLSPAATHTETEAVKSPRRPEDLMARERLMNAREKKEWRNTQMMMAESHKVERLELMAQVEELKEKLKSLTKDMLEVLDENEKLVKQLEIAEEERDKCIKLMESKIS